MVEISNLLLVSRFKNTDVEVAGKAGKAENELNPFLLLSSFNVTAITKKSI